MAVVVAELFNGPSPLACLYTTFFDTHLFYNRCSYIICKTEKRVRRIKECSVAFVAPHKHTHFRYLRNQSSRRRRLRDRVLSSSFMTTALHLDQIVKQAQ